ncbi:MAG: LptF/LptG family permease [Phycisphaerales bacterium]|nr:LptF/LptG family permease [Phycisphaerales bacterium]
MSVLDRYVAKTFLSSFLLLICVGVGLYILVDLLMNLDEFTKDESLPAIEVLRLIVDYYGYNIPLYFSQLAGPMIALSAAFTLGIMLRNNELVALVSSGLPLQRVAAPLIMCAVPLVALTVLNEEFLIPQIAHKIARQHDDMVHQRDTGVDCARDERNAILHARRVDPDGRMWSVIILDPGADGRPEAVIEADSATYDSRAQTWLLERGRRYPLENQVKLGQRADQTATRIDEYAFGLTPEQVSLRRDAQWVDFLSVRQMTDLLRAGSLPNWSSLNVKRHIRLTEPAAHLIMVMLAIPFFLTREPSNVIAAGGYALLLVGVFFAFMFFTRQFTAEPRFAMLYAWAPIMLFAPIAVLRLSNVKT